MAPKKDINQNLGQSSAREKFYDSSTVETDKVCSDDLSVKEKRPFLCSFSTIISRDFYWEIFNSLFMYFFLNHVVGLPLTLKLDP